MLKSIKLPKATLTALPYVMAIVCPASATGTNLIKFFEILKFLADKTLINMVEIMNVIY